jgi:hypothetical protein
MLPSLSAHVHPPSEKLAPKIAAMSASRIPLRRKEFERRNALIDIEVSPFHADLQKWRLSGWLNEYVRQHTSRRAAPRRSKTQIKSRVAKLKIFEHEPPP